ncbi:MAG TPA: helix-turn-helix transcriptional regulator [Gemmataceae bacterium]|nr:helix-turn-helix transcriptional regulator [Gemmataceae bacterium]
MDHLHYCSLFRSGSVTITDVRCRPTSCACGAEEVSSNHTIALPRSGAFVKHIGGKRVLADCNSIMFFNGGEVYQVSHPIIGGDDCTSFAFQHDILLDAVADYEPSVRENPRVPFRVTHGPCAPHTLWLVHRLRQALRGARQEGLAIEERALDLLRAVVNNAYQVRGQRPIRSRFHAGSVHRERTEAAKQFLAGKFHKPLTLAEVARAVHYSPYHLARLFRREVGVPIHQYLNRLRLGAALERLADGCGNLTELALDLGYSSHSHFSDAFRRAFGASPSNFRDQRIAACLRQLSKNLKA